MPLLELSFQGRDEAFSVRHFKVSAALSSLFEVAVWAVSEHDDADLDSIVGTQAGLRIAAPHATGSSATIAWTGVCSHAELVAVEATGVSTYFFSVVPSLWLLSQRRNYKVFQQISAPDIVKRILEGYHITPSVTLDEGAYPKLDYRVQYGETDLAFVARTLEEAGISYWFRDNEGQSELVLSDKPERGERAGSAIPYIDNPSLGYAEAHATQVYRGARLRHGGYKIRDYDFRNPSFRLFGTASQAASPEGGFEQYHHAPGASIVVGSGGGGSTPVADARGAARSDQRALDGLAQRRLDGERVGRKRVSFVTNVFDLVPGTITAVSGHPRSDLGADKRLLVTSIVLEGMDQGAWSLHVQAVFAERAYRPERTVAKPAVQGLQSAIVVGPSDQEIHTDEYGRVRVQFHWDRDGQFDEQSSCWVRVSQGWAGLGYGMITIPRVGQEVLVGFLEGDPDQPVVVGRLYNNTQQVPYKLPEHRTVSTWKSDTSPGSNGFNELKFEDKKDHELVYVQAQKNLVKLVKNNERETTRANRNITVGGNLTKLVKGDETETTKGNLTIEVKGARKKLVKGDEVIVTESEQRILIGGGQQSVIKKCKKELVDGDTHLHIKGDLKEKLDGAYSLQLGGDQQDKVGGRYAQEVGGEIHIKSGSKIIIEAATQISLKGPGGFIDIGPGGVAIQGTMVKINSGGSAGSGSGSSPAAPEDAEEGSVESAPEDDEEEEQG